MAKVSKSGEVFSKYEQPLDSGQISGKELQRFEDIATLIENWCPKLALRILEIGCANSNLLASLKKRGYSSLLGLDPSPSCARFALEHHSIRVFTSTISSIEKLNMQFDLILMIGVMEHIRELKDTLAYIRTVLSPRGKLFIEVPDASRFSDYIDAPYQQFSTEHINYFSFTSLNNLMSTQGYNRKFGIQSSRKLSRTSTMPVITALYEIVPNAEYCILPDTLTHPSLQAYIQASAKIEVSIKARINKLIHSKEPILIWGTGTHTMRLLAEDNLNQVNIVGYIDSNPKYHGLQIQGISIYSPDQIKNRSESILISTLGYCDEIESIIRNDMKMRNRIIKLYS